MCEGANWLALLKLHTDLGPGLMMILWHPALTTRWSSDRLYAMPVGSFALSYHSVARTVHAAK